MYIYRCARVIKRVVAMFCLMTAPSRPELVITNLGEVERCVCVCIKHDDPSLLTLGTRLARAHLCVCERVCVCVCKDNYSVPRRHRERELSGNNRDRKVAASSSSSWRRASSSAGLGVIRRSLLIKRRLKRVGPMRVSRNGLFFRALSANRRSIYKATARRSTSALSYFGWGAFQLSGAAATPTLD